MTTLIIDLSVDKEAAWTTAVRYGLASAMRRATAATSLEFCAKLDIPRDRDYGRFTRTPQPKRYDDIIVIADIAESLAPVLTKLMRMGYDERSIIVVYVEAGLRSAHMVVPANVFSADDLIELATVLREASCESGPQRGIATIACQSRLVEAFLTREARDRGYAKYIRADRAIDSVHNPLAWCIVAESFDDCERILRQEPSAPASTVYACDSGRGFYFFGHRCGLWIN